MYVILVSIERKNKDRNVLKLRKNACETLLKNLERECHIRAKG